MIKVSLQTKIIAPKDSAVKFHGEYLGIFFTYFMGVIIVLDPFVISVTNKSAVLNTNIDLLTVKQ